jgi:ribosome-binding protein aMBF1 (putative translation factor)
MADSRYWRRPGRRDEERRKFAALMRKVEAIRLRQGMTKKAVAAEIGTVEDVLRSWLSGESVGRKESVKKITAFLAKRETSRPRLRPVLRRSSGR